MAATVALRFGSSAVWSLLLLLTTGAAAVGCSDDSGSTPSDPGSGGADADSTDATGTGGGDTDTGAGGTTATGTGGDDGSGTTGDTGTGGSGNDDFWPGDYDPAGVPSPTVTPADADHVAGAQCMVCHVSPDEVLSGGNVYSFAGTVYAADGTTPAGNVQIGVRSGTTTHVAYSAPSGNFWVPVSGTIDWANVEVRVRNANGEKIKSAVDDTTEECNSCHMTGGEATPLKAP